MKNSEVKEKVNQTLNQAIDIEVYFVLDKDEGRIVKKVNVTDEDGRDDNTNAELLGGFIEAVESSFELYNDSEEVLKLSSADERRNALYVYDLDELPEEMKYMKEVSIRNRDDALDTFNFNEDKLGEVTAIVIILGSDERNMVLYKQQYPISLLKRDKMMLAPVPHKNRLAKVNTDILKIDFNFQFCLIDDCFYITDINKMEKICSFTELIKKEARKSIEKISSLGILENVEVLEDELDNITFARKLTKVYKDSKVLGIVSNKKIIRFAQKHSYFRNNPIKTNGDKFVLDTKKSKEAFIKLMNDDLLRSELTDFEYESLAKNVSESKKIKR